MPNLFDRVFHCLQIRDSVQKVADTRRLYDLWEQGVVAIEAESGFTDYTEPGRPDRPVLVSPRQLPRRTLHSTEGRAAMLHSIAHIEFNAINLALDAVYRFRGLPDDYYGDWLKVAAEEAYHFQLVSDYLRTMDHNYGDFPAHNGLWDMAMQTRDDPLVRMAIIPRVMEARGLDVTPGIIERFENIGESRVADILNIIMRDEIGHVETGTRWFHYLCDARGLPRQATFEKLMHRFMKGRVRQPLHRKARISAGFTESELEFLEGMT